MKRALIVRKEFLDLIFDGGKYWEQRSSKTNIRGFIGLIEAGSGLIMGYVELTDSLPAITPDSKYYIAHKVKNAELLKKWKYPWVVFGAKRYDKPIPYNHPKGAVIWVDISKLDLNPINNLP